MIGSGERVFHDDHDSIAPEAVAGRVRAAVKARMMAEEASLMGVTTTLVHESTKRSVSVEEIMDSIRAAMGEYVAPAAEADIVVSALVDSPNVVYEMPPIAGFGMPQGARVMSVEVGRALHSHAPLRLMRKVGNLTGIYRIYIPMLDGAKPPPISFPPFRA